jgi:hypothetical protein
MPAWKPIVGLGFTPEVFANYVRGVTLDGWRPSFLVLHNTQIPRLDEWHRISGERRMAGLATYYRDERHWSAGPHLFVADDLIWAFTPLNMPGVHSPSWNGVAWGVELVGDYDREPFGDDVKRNGMEAMAALHRLAGWTEPRIRLHREDPLTDHHCPGDNVRKEEMEAGVQTLLDLDK